MEKTKGCSIGQLSMFKLSPTSNTSTLDLRTYKESLKLTGIVGIQARAAALQPSRITSVETAD